MTGGIPGYYMGTHVTETDGLLDFLNSGYISLHLYNKGDLDESKRKEMEHRADLFRKGYRSLEKMLDPGGKPIYSGMVPKITVFSLGCPAIFHKRKLSTSPRI